MTNAKSLEGVIFRAVRPEHGLPFVVWGYGQLDDPAMLCEVEDWDFAEHIATYDPEHVTLMEAVIEAGDAPISGPEAREALDAYRMNRWPS